MFFENLKENYDRLSISEQQAIDYLMKQDNIELTTLKEIKQEILVSSSTVIRACKKLGYNTFIDLKYDLKISKELAKNNKESVDEVQQKNLIERNTILDIVSKAAYIIVWPLVTIAGIAMDNQMVYGSFMYLDAPLRKLWNLIKNLGNFALGFLFLA